MFKYSVSVNCPIHNNTQTVYYGILPSNKCLSNGCDNMNGSKTCVECVLKVQETINNRLISQQEPQ